MESTSPSSPAVELRQITRRFARALANDRVNLTVARGEVHALVGENGAGKSTLMKILGGLYQPDSGEIWIHGERQQFRSPADAIAAGVGMVHQHFMLVPPFTVAENVVLGEEGGPRLNPKAVKRRVQELLERYRVDLDASARVADLGVGLQQRVEIVKVLYRNARIIILDEPTAVLTPREVEDFFATIRELKASGATIVIITHKLREVMALSDSLTILRNGRSVAEFRTADTTAEEVARFMVGRDVVLPSLAAELQLPEPDETKATAPPEPVSHTAERILQVRELFYTAKGTGQSLKDISFELRPGEILGIAGVEGNGQSELVELLTGIRFPTSGEVQLSGKDITRASPRERFRAGMACVPEDRHRHGLILDFNLRENLLLGRHHRNSDGRRVFKRKGARETLRRFDVRPPDIHALARQLSGGNQQKVIVAREFTRGAKLLIAAQPTRGVDLGAIEFIHRKLLELREAGTAILLVSAELSEILALSDRVAVMYAGQIVYFADNRGLTEQDLGVHMTGSGAHQ